VQVRNCPNNGYKLWRCLNDSMAVQLQQAFSKALGDDWMVLTTNDFATNNASSTCNGCHSNVIITKYLVFVSYNRVLIPCVEVNP
jgi:hypothetical protein